MPQTYRFVQWLLQSTVCSAGSANAGKRAFWLGIEAHRISSDTELTPGEAKSY
jgi:hypothetical protein